MTTLARYKWDSVFRLEDGSECSPASGSDVSLPAVLKDIASHVKTIQDNYPEATPVKIVIEIVPIEPIRVSVVEVKHDHT